MGLCSGSRNTSGVFTSELLKLDMVLKTVSFESTESMRGELEEKLDSGEEVRPESEMREE